MLVERGTYTFWAAASSRDLRKSLTLELPGETIPLRDLSKPTLVKNYDEKDGMFSRLWYSHKFCDWGGSFIFRNATFENYTKAEILAAAPCEACEVKLYAGDTLLSTKKVSPSRSMDDFQCITIPLEPFSGTADLKLESVGQGNFYRFQFA